VRIPIEEESLAGIFVAIWPAIFVLLLTLVISVFFVEFTFVSGAKASWLILLRFFRIVLILVIPLLVLPQILVVARGLLRGPNWELVQFREERKRLIEPWKHWLLRPFQGIGLSMLIAAKLVILLGIYQSSGIDASVILPPAIFSPWRFLMITAMAITVSILLSCLWGLDDLGVRLYNRKTREIKMIGRYLGMILPILFGFYGMVSIFQEHSRLQAIKYIAQMVVILYPPFLTFDVCHAFYIRRRQMLLLEKLRTTSPVILPDPPKSELE